MPCPDPPSRHDALLDAAWLPYAHALGHRPGEPLAAFVARVRAAVDLRDDDVPEPVRVAMASIITVVFGDSALAGDRR
jgi:hypothetical protein